MAFPVLDIVCLCADWCTTCREYEPTFKALKQAWHAHRCRWIDIEDEADLAGDIDAETFPTLLVALHGQVLFAGPVLPHLSDARRLIEAQLERASAGDVSWPAGRQLAPDQVAAFTALARALSPT